VSAASTGRFEHVAQQARDERSRAQVREAFAAGLRELGVTVVDRNSALTPLRSLTDAEGAVLSPDNHADCPGHPAYLDRRYGRIDPATGLPVPATRTTRSATAATPTAATTRPRRTTTTTWTTTWATTPRTAATAPCGASSR